MAEYVTVEQDGWTTTSNMETAEQIKAASAPPESKEPAETPSEAGEEPEAPPANETAEQKSVREEKAKKYKPIQPRIDELTRQRKEAEARAERAEAELAQARRSPAPAPAEKAPEAQRAVDPSDPEPSDEDPKFKNYTEYLKEWNRWDRRQEDKQRMDFQAQTEIRKSVEKVVTDFSASMKAAIEADPTISERQSDYVTNLKPSIELQPGQRPSRENMLADFILHSKEAAKLMLKENESELRRILTLHPIRFWAELGQLEYRLGAGTPTASAPTPSVSKARPPARTVTGGPPASSDLTGDIDLDTFVKRSNKA